MEIYIFLQCIQYDNVTSDHKHLFTLTFYNNMNNPGSWRVVSVHYQYNWMFHQRRGARKLSPLQQDAATTLLLLLVCWSRVLAVDLADEVIEDLLHIDLVLR